MSRARGALLSRKWLPRPALERLFALPRVAVLLSGVAGCSAAVEPPPPPRAATCPSAVPAPSASAQASPSATGTAAPSASAQAAATPAEPEPYKLLWYDLAGGGDVLLRAHGAGIAVIPAFLASTVEGSRVAVIDPAGLAKWERAFDGVGAADAAVAPDGSIAAIAVDKLDWPKTPGDYEQRRILTIAADGKSARSFRLPDGLSADGLQTDGAKSLLITGLLTGKARLAPGVVLQQGDSVTPRGFVASYSLDGHARWARDFDGAVSVRPVPGDKVLILQSPDPGGAAPTQQLRLGDGKGHDDWQVAVPAPCRIESIETGAGPGILVVAPEGCFEGAPPPPADQKRCAAYRLDAATGKKTSSFALPGCNAFADAAGVAVVSEERRLSLLDAAGKLLWATDLVIPAECLYLGFNLTGVALDASSIYVAGACLGERIGTMFNSPYSRASDRSTTYLARYDRR